MKRRTFTAALVGVLVAPVAAIKGMVRGTAKAAPESVIVAGSHPMYKLMQMNLEYTKQPGRYIYSIVNNWSSAKADPYVTEFRRVEFGEIEPGKEYAVVDISESPRGRSAEVQTWYVTSTPYKTASGVYVVQVKCDSETWNPDDAACI